MDISEQFDRYDDETNKKKEEEEECKLEKRQFGEEIHVKGKGRDIHSQENVSANKVTLREVKPARDSLDQRESNSQSAIVGNEESVAVQRQTEEEEGFEVSDGVLTEKEHNEIIIEHSNGSRESRGHITRLQVESFAQLLEISSAVIRIQEEDTPRPPPAESSINHPAVVVMGQVHTAQVLSEQQIAQQIEYSREAEAASAFELSSEANEDKREISGLFETELGEGGQKLIRDDDSLKSAAAGIKGYVIETKVADAAAAATATVTSVSGKQNNSPPQFQVAISSNITPAAEPFIVTCHSQSCEASPPRSSSSIESSVEIVADQSSSQTGLEALTDTIKSSSVDRQCSSLSEYQFYSSGCGSCNYIQDNEENDEVISEVRV